MLHITQIIFRNYKSFSQFAVNLESFNILVGPNNAGKSTIIGALKILSEGIRKARAKKPTLIKDPNQNQIFGYEIDLSEVPVATENIFHNYNEESPAIIQFRLSDGATLQIFFLEAGKCFFNYDSDNRIIKSPAEFRKYVNIEIGFVPILGPVDHEEKLYQKEAARQALLSYTASRNFRNIWHHYGEDFDDFKDLVRKTWPGMDIDRPEINNSTAHPTLGMFCPEDRIPREIFWAGFGFQVWCQMLTYIIKNKTATIFLVDEPDIYLHSDLQRQLLGILKHLGPDIIVATHSTEMISEADLNDILVISKNNQSARRIKQPAQLKNIFKTLGSNLNPTLTQIAKSKKVLFVEGKDFSLLSKIARILNKDSVASRNDFAVVPVEGFNPSRLKAFKEGIEKTIGTQILSAVIFDRDFRSDVEIQNELSDLKEGNYFAHIHSCKEIENFILIPQVIEKALKDRIRVYNNRTGNNVSYTDNIDDIFRDLTENIKYEIQAQLLSHKEKHEKSLGGKDTAVIKKEILKDFDNNWSDLNRRIKLIPGKDFISSLNETFQQRYKVNVSLANIIDNIPKQLVPNELVEIIDKIDDFRSQRV